MAGMSKRDAEILARLFNAIKRDSGGWATVKNVRQHVDFESVNALLAVLGVQLAIADGMLGLVGISGLFEERTLPLELKYAADFLAVPRTGGGLTFLKNRMGGPDDQPVVRVVA